MSIRSVIIVALVLAGTVLQAESLLAQTVAVGADDCQVGLLHYPTIQIAVNSVAPGGTVLVCARMAPYPEQIVIDKPITVRGVSNGNAGVAMIAIPPGGLVPVRMTVSGLNVAAQIVAQNIANVTLANLTIDGTGSGCPAVDRTAGIAFDRVKRGVAQGVVVRNQVGGCGEGIFSEGSNLAVESSSIHDVNFNGIRQVGGNTKIALNDLFNGGQAGILLAQVSSGTIASNMVQSFQGGVWLDATNNVTITGNTLGPWLGDGVWLGNGAASNLITQNRTSANWYGVRLDVGAAKNSVTLNTVVRTGFVGIADWSVGLDNRITSNSINESQFGIWNSDSGEVIGPNTFRNVTVLTTENPWLP